MSEPSPVSQAPEPSRATSPGRAFLVYSALRLALLAGAFVLLRLLLPDADDLLVVGAAVLLSALLSVVLLRGQREAFTTASMARAAQRRADRDARRARLDGDRPAPGADPGAGPGSSPP